MLAHPLRDAVFVRKLHERLLIAIPQPALTHALEYAATPRVDSTRGRLPTVANNVANRPEDETVVHRCDTQK